MDPLKVIGSTADSEPPPAWEVERCIHRLFEEQAERAPDAPAVELQGQTWSFRRLDRRANGLARRLRELGVGPEVRVGIYVERSLDMIAAVLGVLKAGGAYVPLDPAYPEDRLAYMLEDSRAALLLTQERLAGSLPSRSMPVVYLDAQGAAAPESDAPPESGVGPRNACYVIYTSGSTGRPKGVVVEHRSFTNLIEAQRRPLQLGPGSRVLQFHRFGFDVASSEYFLTLVSGGLLCLAAAESLLPGPELFAQLRDRAITMSQIPPAALAVLPDEPLPHLRTLITGGEAFPAALLARWATGRLFFNVYGPTETTVSTTMSRCDGGEETPAIGLPLANMAVYVLDAAGRPAQPGEPGELFIGGAGVARGYLGRPALTAERFIPDPFAKEPGARMYRTGDLVRSNARGELEFLGRADDQVKIRGFRIELGEIEAALGSHPSVRACAVAAREIAAGDRRLIAYVVPADPSHPAAALRDHLRARLPDYMVPSTFVWMDALPVTPHGKLDRKALPAPDLTLEGERERAAPRTATERALVAIWEDLLKVTPIGVTDDFFALGGHSLLAARLAARMREELGWAPPIAGFFERPTVEALAAQLDSAAGRPEPAADLMPLPRAAGEPAYPGLSGTERRLWLLEQLSPDARAYQLPQAFLINGAFSEAALRGSLRALVQRHELLRTIYPARDGVPVREVLPDMAIPWRAEDLSALPPSEREAAVRELVAAEVKTAFDLQRGPLTRVLVLKIAEEERLVVLCQHHILTDEWSAGLLLRELSALYDAALRGEPIALPALPYQYADHARAEQRALDSGALAASRDYWKARLAGVPRLELPILRPASSTHPGPEGRLSMSLTEAQGRALLAFARSAGCTRFMVWWAALSALLSRYSGQEDFGVGAVMANRDVRGTESLLGFFTNTVILRADLSGDPTFRELLQRARGAAVDAYRHQGLPFDVVVQDQGVARRAGEAPFYDVTFFEATAPDAGALQGARLLSDLLPDGTTSAREPLAVIVGQGQGGLEVEVTYDLSRLDRASVKRLLSHLQTLLDDALAHPDRRVSELALMPGAELAEIARWNDTSAPYPEELCTHHLFEAQARKTPDNPAIEYEGAAVSYRELDRKVNQLAHHLRSLGVGPEVRVGLCVERSLELPIAMLATLKAGGAYVPMDPSYPKDRLAYMLSDAKAPVLLTQSHLAGSLPAHDGVTVLLDAEADRWSSLPETPPDCGVGPDNAMYVLYTSGSTGKPKGATNTHRGLVNHHAWFVKDLKFTPKDRMLQRTAISFDGSVWEFWSPWCTGGCLVIAPRDANRDPQRLGDVIRDRRVTVLHVVPTFLEAMADTGAFDGQTSLRLVAAGGEALQERVRRAVAEAARCEVYNLYGPTESAIDTMSWHGTGHAGNIVPIGPPRANIRAYVLDKALRQVPVGLPGEMYLSTVQLARGYHARSALTAERFVPDPFCPEPGRRMYRTGDLVRWNEQGEIEFLGRIDHQVKIRGFRIELGEIESVLSSHPAVRASTVMAREDTPGHKQLVAYVVPARPDCTPALLREHLRAGLPEFMVPAFVLLDALPVLPNGKVNRQALPAPDAAARDDAGDVVAPRTPTERAIVEIWQDLLKVSPVGVTEDFFALGGHSLLALRMMAAVKARLGWAPPMASLFERATIEALAAQIDGSLGRPAPGADLRPLPRAKGEPAFEGLSGTERRLWFLEQLAPDARAYQVPQMFVLKGAFSVDAFEESLRALAERHEILRTIYPEQGGAPVRRVLAEAALPFHYHDLSASPEAEREAALRALLAGEIKAPFDLRTGPLTRALAVKTAADEQVIVLHQHHIVTDEWSAGILAAELSALYEAALRGEEAALPPLPYQYSDHAKAEQEALDGEGFAASRAYWKAQLAGVPRLILPILSPVSNASAGVEGRQTLRLPEALSRDLASMARSSGCTIFMVWYAAISALLSRYSEQTDFGLGVVMANREVSGAEGLLGFFTNTVVLRADLAGDPTFRELLARSRARALDAYRHQALPFDAVVQDLNAPRRPGETPFYDVSLFEVSAPEGSATPGWSPVEGLFPEGVTAAKEGLAFAVLHGESGAEVHLSYDLTRIDRASVKRLTGHLETLLADAVARPDRRVSELELMGEAERAEIARWNDTAASYPADLCCHHLFEAQARETPDNPAIEYEGVAVSYRELDRRSNQLAHHLRSLGVGPEVRVGLCVERSLELPIAMLATLKAGGAYVPMDPSYPKDRLAYMLSDAKAPVLLTQSHLLGAMPPHDGVTVLLDAEADRWSSLPETPPDCGVAPDNAMYVLYTSGSTGKPKGATNTHRGLVNHHTWFVKDLKFTPKDRMLQRTAISFDGSVWEFWSPWCTGGCLVIAPRDANRDPQRLGEVLHDLRVTVLHVVPTFLEAMADCGAFDAQRTLRLVAAGGEALQERVRRAVAEAARCEVYNLYGPTESAIDTMSWHEGGHAGNIVPIGPPRANIRAYILDKALRQVPVGLPGEMYLSTVQLARGYHARPALTAERFVPDPFCPEPGRRMYRTGDLVRWNEQGEIEFLGRIDHQVKIRGFRIELGEIESVLSAHPAVRASTVVAREDTPGIKRLVAYVVPAQPDCTPALLREHLRAGLPEFMVPAIVLLDRLPVLPNGKVDRNALPAPDTTRDGAETVVAPRTPTERALVEIWQDLLKVSPIGVTDDFFAHGGHSLLALRMMSAVKARLGWAPPMASLFERATIEALAAQIDGSLGRPAPGADLRPLPRAKGEPAFEGLSGTERRLWFLEQLTPGARAYQVPQVFLLKGAFSAAAFEQGLRALAARHEILRTVYPEVDGAPARRVLSEPQIPVRLEDISGSPPGERDASMRALLAEEVKAPFDLQRGPLTRVLVVKLAEGERAVVLHQHHILTDEWSAGVLAAELSALYAAALQGKEAALPVLPYQYADHAKAEQEALDGEGFAASRAYWKEQLTGVPRLELAMVRQAPSSGPGAEGQVSFRLGDEESRALLALARSAGSTRFMVWYAALLAALSRYSRQTDFALGAVMANREVSGTEGLIGFFTNTVVLRTDVSNDPSFRDLLRRARATALDAYRHQALPFDVVVKELGAVRRPGETPFYDVSFFEATAPEGGALEAPPASAVLQEGLTAAKDALSIAVHHGPDSAEVLLSFDTARVDRAAAERLARHLRTLLLDALERPDLRISELALLGEEERRELLSWSRSKEAGPADSCAHVLFEAQADRTPDAAAVEHQGEVLTYRELDRRANQLAHYLRSLGVGPEVRVGICVERSFEMIVAALGVLKAGGAYVPLDPAYPKERLVYTLSDARAAILLAQGSLAAELEEHAPAVLRLDTQWATIAQYPEARPEGGAGPRDTCYVIYTSGSTGKPKGVAVEHRSLSCMSGAHGRTLGVGPGARVIQFHRFGFDVASGEVFVTLTRGGTLCLFKSETLLSGPDLVRELRDRDIHVGHIPPSLLAILPDDPLPGLRAIITGGESCPAAVVTRWAPGRRLFNAYGPTETTVLSTIKECDAQAGVPTIGRPIADTGTYVLDAHGRLAPVGVPGELFIGGAGVARGYLGRPAMTAERFLPDPFADEPGARMYRTGDLVRWTEGGELEFLGRIDDQVKIRGFRIELGEIETALSAHPSVRTCAVVAREDAPGDRRLVAYVVPREGDIRPAALREHLAAGLPEYMIPAAFVALDAIPLTPHGKVDRRALPAPDATQDAGRERVAPRTPTERALVDIWQELLRVEPIGVTDDFFELGGHSLLAVRMMSAVKARLGWAPPMASLFERPTVEALAAMVDGTAERPQPGADLRPAPRQGGEKAYEGLSSTERRIWFLEQLSPEARAYQVPQAFLIKGAFNEAAFQEALRALARRHEILRTTYPEVGGVPARRVSDEPQISWRVEDLTDRAAAEREARTREILAAEIRDAFDLQRGPLTRALILKQAADEWVAVLHQHHILTDEWSAGVLVHELSALYEAALMGKEAALPALRYQYADRARAEQEALDSGGFAASRAYWKAQLAGVPRLQLPFLRPASQAGPGLEAQVTFRLTEEQGRRLLSLARSSGSTRFMVWYALLSALLSRYSGQTDFALGSVSANREVSGSEELLGFLTNTVVLRADISEDPTFRELLSRARATAVGAYQHQALPFDVVVQDQVGVRRTGDNPFYDVTFFEVTEPEGATSPGWASYDSVLPGGVTSAKEPLSFVIWQDRQGTALHAVYDAARLDEASLARLLSHLQALLDDALAHPDKRVSELALTPDAELSEIARWNDTSAPYPEELCIHHLFEAQARRTPDSPAVEYEGEALSYGELDRRANQLAHYLQGLGVGPEVRVGLCVERSLEMAVGLLGTLKAGGAYVPMDPSYPADRLAYMLSDARAEVLLTQSHIAGSLPSHEGKTVLLDTESERWLSLQEAARESGVGPDNAMYVLYTSGSTGRPKGAINTHRGLVNLQSWLVEDLKISPSDRVIQQTVISFDVSLAEIWAPWCAGGTLVLSSRDSSKNALALGDTLRARGVTVLLAVPTLLEVMVEAGAFEGLTSLRCIGAAGEALPDRVRRAAAEAAHCDVYNLYGPTEAAIYATAWYGKEARGAGVPIGRPRKNGRVHVLDSALRPAPVGVPGEMYLSGVQLARGYHARPALTAERFVPDPYSAEPGARMYRTGDLVRYNEQGEIEFLGRVDHQVKIRGYRIELGEIEAAVMEHPEARACTVMAREYAPGDRRLIAYVVPAGAGLEPASLQEHLRARLPEFMVPALVLLERLPLLPNGKIDRHALPAPEASAADSRARSPARTPTERALVGIWEELLKVSPIGVTDDFFALGGHSLLALRMMTAVKQCFGQAPPIAALFEHATIEALAALVDRAAEQPQVAAALRPSPRAAGEPAYAGLSGAERRLWLVEQLSPGAKAYQAPQTYVLRGELSAPALRRSVEALARRHELLRTVYPEVDGAPVRRVLDEAPIPLRVEDVSALPAAERGAAALSLLSAEVAEPFDLMRGPLVRWLVITLAGDEHLIVAHQHHIVTDEWSAGVLWRELSALYAAALRGEQASLPALPYQYADHAKAEQQALERGGFAASRAYWKAQLAGAPRLVLPALSPASAAGPGPEGRLSFRLPADVSRRLQSLGRASGCTRFILWYAAISALLSRHSEQTDFGLGAVMANREVSGTEGLIGFFTNTVVLRADVSSDPTFRELLGRARATALDAYRHQALPFDIVVQDQGAARRPGETPFYDVSLFEVTAPEGGEEGLSIPVAPIPEGITAAKDGLAIAFGGGVEGTEVQLSFDTSRMSREAAAQLAGHLEALLTDAAAHPDRRVSELALMTDAERARLEAWSLVATQPAPGGCLHELFEAQRDRTPQATAVVFNEERITYRELDRRADRLAHRLREAGVGPEVRVALHAPQTPDTIVGILAVMKAGGAYVPLDPEAPKERLAQMIADARAAVLLGPAGLPEALDLEGREVTAIDIHAAQAGEAEPGRPAGGAAPENLAYIIYTSGSTGRPKGVAVTHATIVRSTLSRLIHYQKPIRSFLLTPSFAYDGSLAGLFWMLTQGGAVLLAGDAQKDPAALLAMILRERPSHMQSVPSFYELLLERLPPGGAGPLEVMIVTGEAISPALVRHHHEKWPGVALFNEYGPTEATVWSTVHLIAPDERRASVPIGRPVADLRAYVLDERLRWAPVGLAGELYIGGAQLARGYLDRPGISAERFVPDPFSPEPGARMYRTGDLVRWSAEGALQFLGRVDHQVKIRGFRVELEEVEAALLGHPSVRACVVAAREDEPGQKRLVAYLVPQGEPVEAGALRRHLRAALPDFMIPAAFVRLDTLPLTPNGKVDRKALPAPAEEAPAERGHVGPRTPIEAWLVELWERLLGARPVGIHDDFFTLGGHSLLAVRLLAAIEERFGVAIPLSYVVSHPTVAELAAELSPSGAVLQAGRSNAFGDSPLVPLRRTGQKEPLFCVHAIGGSALSYRELARELSGERPVYGLQSRAPGGDAMEELTIEAMAARYAAAIRRVQPEGPYHLCGWSFGGVVAFEMARQLSRDGADACTLVLMDSVAPGASSEGGEASESGYIGTIALSFAAQGLGVDVRELDALSAAEARVELASILEQAGWLPEGQAERALAAMIETTRAHHRALQRYAPSRYEGAVTLLRARDRDERDGTAPDAGWSPLCAGPLDVRAVPGAHHTLLSPPHVAEIARALRGILGGDPGLDLR